MCRRKAALGMPAFADLQKKYFIGSKKIYKKSCMLHLAVK
jgi:hypothetical protein